MIVLLMFGPPYCLLQEDLTSWYGEMSGATVITSDVMVQFYESVLIKRDLNLIFPF